MKSAGLQRLVPIREVDIAQAVKPSAVRSCLAPLFVLPSPTVHRRANSSICSQALRRFCKNFVITPSKSRRKCTVKPPSNRGFGALLVTRASPSHGAIESLDCRLLFLL